MAKDKYKPVKKAIKKAAKKMKKKEQKRDKMKVKYDKEKDVYYIMVDGKRYLLKQKVTPRKLRTRVAKNVLAEHIKNHLRSDENLILDRCILDGYVYTKYQVANGKVSEQVLHAFNGVYALLMNKLDYIFYTDPADVKLVDDGERSMDFAFRQDIIALFEDLIMHKMSPCNKKKVVWLSGTVDQRMKIIEKYLNEK